MAALRDMTPEQRAEMYARADAAVADAAAELVKAHRARNIAHGCLIPDFYRWSRERKQCMLFVRHGAPTAKGIWVSRCGGREQFFLPDSQSQPRPQTSDRFVLTLTTDFIRSKMPPDFKGVIPELVGDKWSEAERVDWNGLAAVCRKINYEIEMTPRRRRFPGAQDRMPYGYTA